MRKSRQHHVGLRLYKPDLFAESHYSSKKDRDISERPQRYVNELLDRLDKLMKIKISTDAARREELQAKVR